MPINLELYPRGWRHAFRQLLAETRDNLYIVSPYIRHAEAKFVTDTLSDSTAITTITRLHQSSLIGESLEVSALARLAQYSPQSTVVNLPSAPTTPAPYHYRQSHLQQVLSGQYTRLKSIVRDLES